MKFFSHVSLGVRDIEKSLRFYRDVLGLEVVYDVREQIGDGGAAATIFANPAKGSRRAVYLREGGGDDAGFLVLAEIPADAGGKPIRLDQHGISHFGWWVKDLNQRVERAKTAGVKILAGPTEFGTEWYAEPPGRKVATCLMEDPDGIIIQLEQRLS